MSLIVFVLAVGLTEAISPQHKLFSGINYRLGCLTPDRVPGVCVPYVSCPGIKDIIPKHDAKFILQALGDHTCGIDKGTIYVCCPGPQQPEAAAAIIDKPDVAKTEEEFPSAPVPVNNDEDRHCSQCICPARRKPTRVSFSAEPLNNNCGIKAGSGLLKEHPWSVLLRLRLPTGHSQFTCVGVLISARHVLTAAHCIKNTMFPKSAVIDQARVGEYNLLEDKDCDSNECAPEPQNVDVETIIIHPNFKVDVSQDYDIAVVRLKTPVVFNPYVQPICLPSSTVSNSASDNYWVVGWGTGFTDQKASLKSSVQLRRVPTEQCKILYEDVTNISDDKICAGIKEDDETCQSGSPLMTTADVNGKMRWYVQGIFSMTPSACGTPSAPSIFTSVSKYRKWILNTIRE